MANIGTGNLVISTQDIDVPERGVDLEFHRYWNSQSRHDYNDGTTADDGGGPAIFGNYWTNNYDAHIVFRPAGTTYAGTTFTKNTISVYDETGFRCDYVSTTSGTWTPCAGVHATLEVDPTNACDYWLVRLDGTAEYFHQDDPSSPQCGDRAGKMGRLYEIVGRNENNSVTLNYSYLNSNSTTDQNITKIIATHSDGHTLTLQFGVVNNRNELATITRDDDGAIYQYSYNSYGQLTEVDKPDNNINSPSYAPPGDIPEIYNVSNGVITEACGPRATISSNRTVGAITDGACITFGYNSTNSINAWTVYGVLNFQPADGVSPNQALWKNHSTLQAAWSTTSFVGPGTNTACGNVTYAVNVCDTDDHQAGYTVDSLGRVTLSAVATGSQWLISTQTWDTVAHNTNNLLASQNPQEYVDAASTNFAYDSAGMPTTITLPPQYVSGGPVIRPLYTFTYDSNENVRAACDADYNASHTGSCPTTPGAGGSVSVYNYTDAAEPNGYLIHTYKPMGYGTTFTYNYNSANEPGDYGLPTMIQGDQISQNDGSSPAPYTKLTYDALGNVSVYGHGNGQWQVGYDSLNRPVSLTDPDGVITRTCYNTDGSVEAKESAQQYVLDTTSPTLCGSSYASSFSYDADGNITHEYHHFDNTTENTERFYDGLDRIVEAKINGGAGISGDAPLIRRYIYDLTQGNATLNIAGNTVVHGYGNIYKTQSFLPGVTSPGWYDISGSDYDAADRAVRGFSYSPDGTLGTSTYTYDGQSAGYLSTLTDALGNTTTLTVNGRGEILTKTFTDKAGPTENSATPNISFAYEADGRLAAASSSVSSDVYKYDTDGNLLTHAEGAGTSVDNPTIAYAYYPNGWRKSLSIQTSGGVFTNPVLKYNYQLDGLRSSLYTSGWSSWSNPFSWTYTGAGRVQTQSDPQSGNAISGKGVNYLPKTETYDINEANQNNRTGQLTSLTFPSHAQYTSITEDAEGGILSYSVTPPAGFTPVAPTTPDDYVKGVELGYDVRGELTSLSAISNATSANGYTNLVNTAFVYGYPNSCTASAVGQCQSAPSGGADPYTGAATADSLPSNNSLTSPCNWTSPVVQYDDAGRYQQSTSTTTCTNTKWYRQRVYDAENHVTSDACNDITNDVLPNVCGNSGGSYIWGPSGTLRSFAGSVFHWDGNNLLYVSDENNNVTQFDIEKLGVILYSGSNNATQLITYDRDFSGSAVDWHNDVGAKGVNATPNLLQQRPYTTIATIVGNFGCTDPINGNCQGDPRAAPFDAPRADGYKVGNLLIQGVRAYDSGTGQWITPDSYKGAVGDPMSQRQYQWNGGNPVANGDPSGYKVVAFGYYDTDYTVGQNVEIDAGGFVAGAYGYEIGAAHGFLIGGVISVATDLPTFEVTEPLAGPAEATGGAIIGGSIGASLASRWGRNMMKNVVGPPGNLTPSPTGAMTLQSLGISKTVTSSAAGTLTQNWARGTWSFTAGPGGGDIGGYDVPGNQTLTGTYMTDFGQTTQFWANANQLTALMEASSLNTCVSCGWSGQL